MKLLVVLGLVACASTAREPIRPSPFVDIELWQIKSEEVSFTAGRHQVSGTIVVPVGDGPFPAIVLLAGSGPTDRDWNSPLLVSTNGSGKLLAEAIAKHGAVVLRFDKAGTGKNPGPPQPWTIDTYREEGLAALALVKARKDVRADQIFVAGHSEGGIHATRLVQAAPDVSGVIYLSSAVRSMADTILTQLEHQFRNPLAGLSEADIKRELTSLRAAFADFFAGKPVDPTTASALPPVQHLLAGMFDRKTEALARVLLSFDNAVEAAKLRQPVLILNGAKDVQIDPQLDAARLDKALRTGGRDVTFQLAPDADHVLKHETKTMAELRADLAAVQTRYNAEDRTLDPGVVQAIVGWLLPRTK